MLSLYVYESHVRVKISGYSMGDSLGPEKNPASMERTSLATEGRAAAKSPLRVARGALLGRPLRLCPRAGM